MLDTIELSKKLIEFDSVTPAKQDIFDFLIKIFEEQGFDTKQLNFDGDGSYEVINLMATYGSPQTNGKHFNFLCHVDVVPPGNIEDWDTHPFEPTIKDGYLYGRGSEDMKGCTAASIISVFKFIKDNPDFNGAISFIITGDEEADSINGVDKVVNWLQENNIRIDGSIATESSSEKVIGDQIKVGRKGAVDVQIEVIGKQGHAAYPQLAQNPVHCLSKIISFFDDQVLDQGAEYFEPSTICCTTIDVGNSANNVIPSRCSATLNIRFNNLHTSSSIISLLNQHIKDIKKSHGSKINMKVKVSGEAFINGDTHFTRTVADVIKKSLKISPVLSTSGGTSDARFIKDVAEVLEVGLVGKTIHQSNEKVALKDIVSLKNLYKAIITRYFSDE